MQPHQAIKRYAKGPNDSKVSTCINSQSRTVDIIKVIHEELKTLDLDGKVDI